MGERKVLNKYFPPDFDPARLPKQKRATENSMKVRMMMAMTVQCSLCRVFIYKGTKFNMRKEDALGEDYLGLQIYRFYFKCPKCSSEITFKTDPEHYDYIVEHGASRTTGLPRVPEIYIKKSSERNNQNVDDLSSSSKNEYKSLCDIQAMLHASSRHRKLEINSLLTYLQSTNNEDIEKNDKLVNRMAEELAKQRTNSYSLDKYSKEKKHKKYLQKKKTVKTIKHQSKKIASSPHTQFNSLSEHKTDTILKINGQKMIFQPVTS